MSNRAVVRVGRLLEVRVETGYRSVADVQEIFAQIATELGRVTHASRFAMVVDWRRCPIMSSEAADVLLDSLKRTNARVERCVALAARDSPLTMLQFMRLVRAADNPNRRVFDDPEQAVAWLSEILSPEEQLSLRHFVLEPTRPWP